MTLTLDRPRRWPSYTIFALVAVAALVNLSAFWRLPHLIAAHGGSAFIAVYVVATLIVGLPLVAGQLLLARGTNLDIPAIVAVATARSRVAWLWRPLAGVMLTALFLLLAIYAVVAAWGIAFAVRALAGVLPVDTTTTAAIYFDHFVHNSARAWGWLLLLITGMGVLAGAGFRRCLIPAMRVLACLLLAGILGVLAVVLLWGEAGGSLAQWLAFRPEDLTWSAVLAGLGQIVFGLGLGSGVLLALGGYLPAYAPVGRLASVVVVSQVVVSLFAAAAVALVVQSAGLAELASLQQLFIVLPVQGGALHLGAVLLLLVAAAAVTTAVVLFEPLVLALERRFGCSRLRASVVSAAGVLVVSMVVLLSFGPLSVWPGVDQHLFQQLVWLTGGILLPLGALWLGIVSVSLVEQQLTDSSLSRQWRGGLWLWLVLLRIPALLALIVVALQASGALGWVRALWGLD